MQDEIWKDVPGYEGLYQASRFGEVRSLHFRKPRLMRAPLIGQRKTYRQVFLNKNGKQKAMLLHRIIMETFEPHPDAEKLVVNHLDRNPNNCALDNLAWESWGGNMAHGRKEIKKEKRIAHLEAALREIAALLPDGSPLQAKALTALGDVS